MTGRSNRGWRQSVLGTLLGVAAGGLLAGTAWAQSTLTVGYMKHPIQEANLAMMEAWAGKNGVKLTKVPMAYDVFNQKVLSSISTAGAQFDLVWHNDDWGQVWEPWVTPTDDVAGMDQVAKSPLEAFVNRDGKVTVVPMVHTVGTFFYRTDLLSEAEVPKTLADIVTVSKRLQADGKVKWGYVGGMKMNHTWFSLWWSTWANQCDIFLPIYERDNKKLTEAGWKPAIAEPCHREVVEYWWDAINTHKISPPGMTAYGRDEANAIFMAGEAAFTLVDSTHFADFNNPQKSKIAGKVGMARFPLGPRRQEPMAWNEIWGWAIPKDVPEERKKVAKAMLGAMLTDLEGQVRQWEQTGGPPPNVKAWALIADKDPVFKKLKEVVFDVTPPTHAAYYFPAWPAVHKAYSDTAIKALTGKREDIPKVLEEGIRTVHAAATGR
jgi:ABC-type glycerol-3-phosphate transport system substrate-binding protein